MECPRAPTARSEQRRQGAPERLSRRAKIWLATLSTVVSVSTGMFSLRDEVFPQDRPVASATAESSYRTSVGKVCDKLSVIRKGRSAADRQFARRLRKARTTLHQRNAILDAY